MADEKKLPQDALIDPKLVALAKLFSEFTSILVFLVGALVLIGWKFKIAALTVTSSNVEMMTPNTAVGLLFLGVSLFMLQEKRSKKWMRYLGKSCALIVITLGTLSFIEYLIGKNLFIDTILFNQIYGVGQITAYSGRVTIGSALVFILLGLSLLFIRTETKHRVCPSQIFAFLAGAVSVVVIVGHLHNIQSFFLIARTSSAMTIYVAVVFFMTQIGVLLARPDRGLVKVIVTNGFVGRFARIILPITFIGPLVLGWLVEYGEHKKFYNLQFGVGIETTTDIIAFFVLVLIILVYLESKEKQEVLMKETLLKNEKKYHNLVDTMNEGLGVQDKNGILTFLNKRACDTLGYKLEELIGKPTTILFDKENQKILKENIVKRKKGAHDKYEMKWLRKDGTTIDTIISPTPFFDANGEYDGSMAIYTDITEHKKSEEKLKESEQNFRNIFNASIDGILLIDTQTMKFVMANSAMCEQLGYGLDEITTFGLKDIHPAKDLAYVQKQIGSAVKGETKINLDIPVKRKNGTVFYVDISAAPITIYGKKCMLGVFRDITERKKAVEELKKAQLKSASLANELEKFKLAVDGAVEHIVITNANGSIIYANRAVETITGFTNAETVGAKAGTIWGGHMPKEFYDKMWHTIKDEKKAFVGEATNYKKNGAPYVASLNIAPILDKNGAVEFFVGIERDITKEKKVEEMKNDFISFVSHQLRTPLTVMRWNAEMLRSKEAGKLNCDQKRYIAEIDRGEQRMALLINSLLNISRLESGRLKISPKPIDLESFITNIVSEDTPYAAAKNCTIIFTKPKKKLPPVKIDEMLTKEVISNLLNNATRYSQSRKCDINVSLEQKDEFFQINVVDQGIGIPIDVQDKIFSKFYRADNAVKLETEGAGLGLYMAKLIVETSGGTIWFESTEGKGSAFHFTIPKDGMREVKGEKELSV